MTTIASFRRLVFRSSESLQLTVPVIRAAGIHAVRIHPSSSSIFLVIPATLSRILYEHSSLR